MSTDDQTQRIDTASPDTASTDTASTDTERIDTQGIARDSTDATRGLPTPGTASLPEAAPAPAPTYRTGPAFVPVTVGILGLLVAALVLLQTATTVRIDWARLGPISIVVTGLVLVGLGLLGMRSRSRESA
jgi:hypothetical protein